MEIFNKVAGPAWQTIIGYLLILNPNKNRVVQGFAMSLIRTALVLGAVVYAMPTDAQKQQQLLHSASDTVVWGLTFCQREPATCAQAKAVGQQLLDKARFGAALAGDIASKWSEQHSGRKAATTLTIEDALATPANQAIVQDTPDPSING